MAIQVSGRLHAKFDTKQVTERFQKREFVLELTDNPSYPQLVLFQLTGDRCGTLDAFDLGDRVRVDFSLRGREWTSRTGDVRYFNSLDVWTIDREGESAESGQDRTAPQGDSAFDDDVPF